MTITAAAAAAAAADVALIITLEQYASEALLEACAGWREAIC